MPGDSEESLFIATQVGKIFYISKGSINTFLDIRSQIIELGTSNGGYDERGLIGLAFHPAFYYNGLFYIHYSLAGTQGPGALSKSFKPNPCDSQTLNLQWTNRDTQYDHIDTVEEWVFKPNGQPTKRRTLLNLRRPFLNHNGVNSLNFSPETGKLVLTTGDGGSGYDPFNLSQNNIEICGKIIEIDVTKNTSVNNPPVVTRFDELPISIQETLTVMSKGVRNIPGISFQRFHNQYIKYVGNVGQDLVESIFSFVNYRPIPVTQLVQSYLKSQPEKEKFINLGWRGWEGDFPTSLIADCSNSSTLNDITTAYYNDAVKTSTQRLLPLVCYFHKDSRPDKLSGSALTGVQPYMGNRIPDLTGSVVFTDFAQNEESKPPVRGVLAYTRPTRSCKLNDFSIIETDYNFGSESSYYVCLGTNMNQTRLYLGVYGSFKVTDLNKGTIFEILP
ncbi:PQQ-dependent sugar dehydrogenase [Romboutsia timonensis]|uniref:PQQ-dependent sugar dehydrogenase n=1 Tax=Romboutsia timonensis TaxID=1776391 RepID=UPI002A7F8DB1|nr:PQQ-dependent sugar dehydrogenase [Romboutsia timonensis]MDY3960480.1 PQQ-dependent sugar dehydrogenase [Romboutsia timonensis]